MGFPSPAGDYKQYPIDLSKELVQQPASTFYFRVSGKSMVHSIPDGAILVVDRSIKPGNSSVILVELDGEFTVRRLVKTDRMTVLHADNPAMNLQVWGVVTAAMIRLKINV